MSIFKVVNYNGLCSKNATHVLLADLPDIDSPEQAFDLTVEKWNMMRLAPGVVDDDYDTCGFCKWQKEQLGGCAECLVAIASIGCNIFGSFWKVYRQSLVESCDTRGPSDDIYLFLLALRDGGVEAGKKFYERWREAREQENS